MDWLFFGMLVLCGNYSIHDKGMKFAGAEGAYCDQIVRGGAPQLDSASSRYEFEQQLLNISQEFLGNESSKCTPWTQEPRPAIF